MSHLVRSKSTLAAFAVLAAGFATAAEAATVKLSDGTGSGAGGEFIATVTSGSVAAYSANGLGTADDDSFRTFCIERDEFINFGVAYNATITTAASQGGAGGPSPDPLNAETAWLYSNFVAGTLAGYDNSVAAADALQLAIWKYEQEWSPALSGLALSFWTLADQAVNGPTPTWSGLGNVRVLHLEQVVDGVVVDKQDQLVLVPTPVAGMGGGVLMVGLAVGRVWQRRRRDGQVA